MRHQSLLVAVAALSLTVLAVPARSQNFVNGSVTTLPPGNLRITASPAHMFGPDERPDRTGAAVRVGYGITDAVDVEAKSAFFDGVTLLGGDGHFRLLDGRTTLVLGAGAHQALMREARDSTAIDLAAELSVGLTQRLSVYAATSYSREAINGVEDSGFNRFYVVPGIRTAVAKRLDLVVEGGVGFNDESPSYLAAGLSFHVPVTESARGHR
jgi:hypothetical protein